VIPPVVAAPGQVFVLPLLDPLLVPLLLPLLLPLLVPMPASLPPTDTHRPE
jgi:hypothetical protein